MLAKKKRIEQERVEDVIDRISDRVRVDVREKSDIVAANELQQETLLYPMDYLLLAIANDQDSALVTFDSELLDSGASAPADVLD